MPIAKLSRIANLPQGIRQFVIEAKDELKKVTWPSRELTIRYTIIVVIATLVTGSLIGGFDYLLTFLIEKLI